jgi:hypothetical protein
MQQVYTRSRCTRAMGRLRARPSFLLLGYSCWAQWTRLPQLRQLPKCIQSTAHGPCQHLVSAGRVSVLARVVGRGEAVPQQQVVVFSLHPVGLQAEA